MNIPIQFLFNSVYSASSYSKYTYTVSIFIHKYIYIFPIFIDKYISTSLQLCLNYCMDAPLGQWLSI